MSFRVTSTSTSVRPQQDNAGIIFPEFPIYEIIKPVAFALSKGEYAKGSRLEPIITSFKGLPIEVIESVFRSLKNQPPRVSYVFPMETKLLPYITIVTESVDTSGTMIGNDAGVRDELIVSVTDSIVLTPSAGAVGGETVFNIPNAPVVSWSTELVKTVSGVDIELFEIDSEYTIDVDSGQITLDSALGAGDELTLTKYSYYSLPGGEYFSSHMNFSVVIFIDSLNPLVSKTLAGIIWRELMINTDLLEEYGLTDINFGIRTNSLWDQSAPALGIRCECALTGTVEWHAYQKQISARTLSIALDDTSGNESVVLYEDDLASFGLDITSESV